MLSPLISVGIIFKNDIRCIERCLKALQPLRNAVPAELVMADTGSTDGSREIAEKYADILIDFPWIDDFAAARNAVMERCSGIWYFSIDTDEYLDEDVSELVSLLCESDRRTEPLAVVTIRNYDSYEMDSDYTDFTAGRIVRMSTGVRYTGAIHEHLTFKGEVPACSLPHVILHHDGYVELRQNSEIGKAKAERNVQMLKKCLEREPDSLMLRMQLIESGMSTASPEYLEQIRQSVEMIREKKGGWERIGPPILRYAVYVAGKLELPEWNEWVQMAKEWFPDSMFTRLDVEYAAFVHYLNEKDSYEEALRCGRRYLKALEDYRNGIDPLAQSLSTLQKATPYSECTAKIHMINTCAGHNRLEEAFELIKSVDYSCLTEEQMAHLIGALQDVHYKSTFDTAPVITKIWDMISDPNQPSKKKGPWEKALLEMAGKTFLPENADAERKKEGFVRNAYTLYLPLRGKCEIGTAAAVLETDAPDEIETMLAEVCIWDKFPIHAFAHALECGVRFPLSDQPMNVEEMDSLVSRLSRDKERYFPLALRLTKDAGAQSWPGLCWARGLVIAAVRTYPWSGGEQDGAQGMALAQAFAEIEKAFLPRCYAEEVLQKERLFALPPLHRFGWYCAQAFDELNAGNAAGYVRLLRTGLDVCLDIKNMVEFLLDRTPELQRPAPSDELRALAGQIRAVLSNFAPGDPAVAALKQSEAYQKVASLIEGTAVPIAGGLLQ